MMTTKHPKGSIALISVIVIGAVALIIVLGMSRVGISTLDQHGNTIAQRTLYYTAESCLEEALTRLENNPSFTSETLIFDDDTSCEVTVSGSGTVQIDIAAHYIEYTENYQATATLTQSGELYNITLTGWQET